MKLHLVLLTGFSLLMPGLHSGAEESAECVILLHGMGRTERSMSKIEDRLQDAGYAVWNHGYDSTSETIDTLSESAVGSGIQYCEKIVPSRIHFVTHSLGGILVRNYFQDNTLEALGRVVMLAPPNKGSEVVDVLDQYSLYAYAMGPAGMALGTDADSVPNQLSPIAGEIGVIAGNSTSDPWFSPLIPGDDDGKVSVERTRLEEMQDFLVVDAGHTFIMRDKEVIDQVVYFLREGKFNPRPPSPGLEDYRDR